MTKHDVTVVYDGFVRLEIVQTPDGLRERVITTDSICLLIYVKTRDCVLLVRQPRAPMMSASNPTGEITELCAGRFDVELPPRTLAAKEASEELGTHVSPSDVFLLNNGEPMAVSAGILNERSYLGFVSVDPECIEDQEHTFGAPGENERIIRQWIPAKTFIAMQCEDVRVFALQQWFRNYQCC